jgi:hypothetical protein
MKISECCGAPANREGVLEMGICPRCKEHCEFIEEDEGETQVEGIVESRLKFDTSNYHKISSDQEYDTLAKSLPAQLEQYPTQEIKFKRKFFSRTQYDAYVLDEHQGPFPLNNSRFIDAGSVEVIANYLDTHLKQGNLPKEIRIIRANYGRPNLDLFFVR